jgi:hypothetical protein
MKKQMNEARGVPAGITNYATKIFNDVLEKLKSNKFKRQSPFDTYSAVVDAPGKFLKDDKPVQISKIKVNINFDFYPSSDIKKIIAANPKVKTKTDKLLLTGLGMEFFLTKDLTKNYNLKVASTENPILHINFVASEDLNDIENNVYKLLNDNYDTFLSTFGHEIQHHINMEAKGEDDIALRTKYRVVSNPSDVTEYKSLSDFVFNLYYLSLIENIVRPTELKTTLDNKKVTKKQFQQVYYDSEMYHKFEICENTTYEKLCNELLKDLEKSLPPIIFKHKTKSEIIEIMLTKTFINMIDEGASFLKMAIFDKMPNAPIDEIDSVFNNKFEVFLKKHMFIKYKPSKDIYGEKDLDVEKTYRSLIKDMNITATKMKKKIAKLYEDLPYEYEN